MLIEGDPLKNNILNLNTNKTVAESTGTNINVPNVSERELKFIRTGLQNIDKKDKNSVKKLQKNLIDLGLLKEGNDDGIWGPKTEAAYKSLNSPYTEVNSTKADVFRGLLPVPTNVGQALSKEVLNDSRISENSLSMEEKAVLYNTIKNAQKRTDILSGGNTEYEDYKGNYGSSKDFNQWFNRGKISAKDAIQNSVMNPGFRVASTLGRGQYWKDPLDDDKIYYTDVYDWNKNEKNFKGDNMYQNIRNTVRDNESKEINKDKHKMNIQLSIMEMENYINKMKNKK